MAKFLVEMFGVSLALTLVLELAVGFCFGMRSRNCILLIILVNIFTNPAAVLLCWLGAAQIPVELGVLLVEAIIYFLFSKDKRWNLPHPFLYTAAANLLSWSVGILIQRMGG